MSIRQHARPFDHEPDESVAFSTDATEDATIDPDEDSGGRGGEKPTLALYFRDMGRHDLIDAERERELARTIEDARRALARIARSLPADCRRHCLASDPAGPERGRSWALADVARFCERLEGYRLRGSDTRLARAKREARVHAARLRAARDEFIRANLRLVIHVAKKCARRGMPFAELVQEGNIGLIRAVEKFDYRHGNKFSTYAHWWIRQSIERSLANTHRLIRIPVHMSDRRRKVLQATRELRRRLGGEPTAEDVAAFLGLETEQVEQALAVIADPRSLDEMAESDETGDPLQVVEDPDAVTPFERLEFDDTRRTVRRTLHEELTDRERRILRLRFGIGGEEGLTLDRVGRMLSVSRERVRQIEREAIAKLRGSETLAHLYQ